MKFTDDELRLLIDGLHKEEDELGYENCTNKKRCKEITELRGKIREELASRHKKHLNNAFPLQAILNGKR